MVDLFNYDESEDQRAKKSELDTQRIKEHLVTWNHTAIDAVFGLLTRDSLNYVCLFINKVDKLEDGNSRRAHNLIIRRFKGLIQELEVRCGNYANFEARIGFALQGTNVVGNSGLLEKLAKFSAPMEKKKNA